MHYRFGKQAYAASGRLRNLGKNQLCLLNRRTEKHPNTAKDSHVSENGKGGGVGLGMSGIKLAKGTGFVQKPITDMTIYGCGSKPYSPGEPTQIDQNRNLCWDGFTTTHGELG